MGIGELDTPLLVFICKYELYTKSANLVIIKSRKSTNFIDYRYLNKFKKKIVNFSYYIMVLTFWVIAVDCNVGTNLW